MVQYMHIFCGKAFPSLRSLPEREKYGTYTGHRKISLKMFPKWMPPGEINEKNAEATFRGKYKYEICHGRKRML